MADAVLHPVPPSGPGVPHTFPPSNNPSPSGNVQPLGSTGSSPAFIAQPDAEYITIHLPDPGQCPFVYNPLPGQPQNMAPGVVRTLTVKEIGRGIDTEAVFVVASYLRDLGWKLGHNAHMVSFLTDNNNDFTKFRRGLELYGRGIESLKLLQRQRTQGLILEEHTREVHRLRHVLFGEARNDCFDPLDEAYRGLVSEKDMPTLDKDAIRAQRHFVDLHDEDEHDEPRGRHMLAKHAKRAERDITPDKKSRYSKEDEAEDEAAERDHRLGGVPDSDVNGGQYGCHYRYIVVHTTQVKNMGFDYVIVSKYSTGQCDISCV